MAFKFTKIILLTILISVFLAWGNDLQAGKDKKDKEKKDTTVAVKPPRKKKSFDDSLKVYRKFDGLFKLYQDTTKGTMLMVIKKNQLDKEFIYFSYSENGPANVGGFRGNFRDNKLFAIRKYFDKIEFVMVNNSFYFDPNNPLSRSADANISPGILLSKKIMDTDHERGEYLINADDIFLTEVLQRIKPHTPRGLPPDAYFSLGSLSKDKTKMLKVRNYPQNTDVVVEYVFENSYPSVGGGAEVTDERNVSIQVQHTLIEVPKNGFNPRFDDQRVGYFTTHQNDMTSASATPYHDFIHRWNLEKKDKNAPVSEPVEPIIWWIENTTPKEFRETIKKAALTWNEAFEAAGFRNAVAIYEQSDTASWDAGDIRYNVLRWTSSPSPIFGGYGPSFVNPKTGQILGADIMLEYVFVTNKLKQEKLFDKAGLGVENLEFRMENAMPEQYCTAGDHLHQSAMFGKMAIGTLQSGQIAEDEFIKQSLYYLVLHELGHTLGLNHNMKASQMLSPAEINDKSRTSVSGLTGSVMDYPTVNIAPDKSKQGEYFTSKPGPYDKWAIEFGYRQFADSVEETVRLNKILDRSTEPALAFGNDADDMRAPGMHIDPRVMIGDLTNDALTYMADRIKLVNKLSSDLIRKYTVKGESYHELRNAYLMLTAEHSNAATVISRYVGGVYVERAVVGQPTKNKPFTPVKYDDQKRAVDLISKNIFAPEAFRLNNSIYNYLQVQRRGFGMMGQNEDPKIHERVLGIQKGVFDHWLHPNVLKRLTDTELYGNKYSVVAFMNDLTDAVFKADISETPNTFRQNLQVEYVSRMAQVVKTDLQSYDNIAKANLTYQLKKIQKLLDAHKGADVRTIAHREYLAFLIQKALAVK